MPSRHVTRTAPQQFESLPQIVDGPWICSRYRFSSRMLETHIREGTIKPFKAGRRTNKFYADEVVAALEGLEAVKRWKFIAAPASWVTSRSYTRPPVPLAELTPVSFDDVEVEGYDGE